MTRTPGGDKEAKDPKPVRKQCWMSTIIRVGSIPRLTVLRDGRAPFIRQNHIILKTKSKPREVKAQLYNNMHAAQTTQHHIMHNKLCRCLRRGTCSQIIPKGYGMLEVCVGCAVNQHLQRCCHGHKGFIIWPSWGCSKQIASPESTI